MSVTDDQDSELLTLAKRIVALLENRVGAADHARMVAEQRAKEAMQERDYFKHQLQAATDLAQERAEQRDRAIKQSEILNNQVRDLVSRRT